MKLLKLALLGSAALTMSAATAVQAGDLAVIKSPGEGFWIGGGIGGQFAIGDAYANFGGSESGSGSAVPILRSFGGVVDDGDLETESFFGTVGAGYDMQVNQSLVVGIFGDYSFASDATANLSGGGGFIDGGFVIDASFAIGDNWFIGGRVGYLVTPETLFYGLVGYSQFDVGAKLDAHGGAGPVAGRAYGRWSGTRGGVTGGAGVETMFTKNISGRLEYRYANIGSFGVNGPDNFVGSPDFVLEEFESSWNPHIHRIMGVIAYRF